MLSYSQHQPTGTTNRNKQQLRPASAYAWVYQRHKVPSRRFLFCFFLPLYAQGTLDKLKKMFTKLILEASEEAERERTPIKMCSSNDNAETNEKNDALKLPPKKEYTEKRMAQEEVELTLPPKKQGIARKSEAELYREFVNNQTIIEKVSEYLFDLFDANLTTDFKKMEAFEKRAVKLFDPEVEEYTFEQEQLHREFCDLFEELVESFLSKEGYTYEEFYEEAKKAIDEKHNAIHRHNELVPQAFKKYQPSEMSMAEEIHGVVLAVSNFQLWADEMRQIRKNELEWDKNDDDTPTASTNTILVKKK